MLLLLQVSSPGSGPPVPMSQAYQDGSPMPVYGMCEWCVCFLCFPFGLLHVFWINKRRWETIKKFCVIANTARTNFRSKKVEDIKMLTVICYNNLQYPGRTQSSGVAFCRYFLEVFSRIMTKPCNQFIAL